MTEPGSRLTLICGRRHSGKTREAAAFAHRFEAGGFRVGGILSVAGMQDGVKESYAFRDLQTDERVVYARRRTSPPAPGMRAYEFLPGGIQFGCGAIRRAAASGVDVLIVDEIGPLEMEGGGLWEPVKDAVVTFAGRIVLTVRPGLVEALCRKLGIGAGETERIMLDDAGGSP